MTRQCSLSNINFNLVKVWLTFISLFFFQSANKSIADSTFTFNREFLIGEWSKPGECNKTRFIYTADGRYIWLEKNGTIWRNLYNGIYVTSPTRLNSLVIAEGPNMGGEIIEIQELTRTTYKGEWKLQLSEDGNAENKQDVAFSYVRCQGTALRR